MINDGLINFLKSAVSSIGPSGAEEVVQALFKDFVSPFVDEVYEDVLGNCVAHKAGQGEKVMLVAHADEIGFIVHHIDENGFVYIREIGGVDTNLLPGRELCIEGLNGQKVCGVVGKQPIHLQEKGKAREWECEDLWVDLGVKSKEEALKLVDIGCYASFPSNEQFFPSGRIKSKALDNRSGLTVLAGVAQALKGLSLNCDLYLVASVQEELGARGAKTAAEQIQPDKAIAFDVTHATDYPSMSPIKHGNVQLDGGAVVAYGPNLDKELTEDLCKAAQSAGVGLQKEVIARPTGTDINPIQICGLGVKTALLSIPCRYMHTPVEMVSLNDIESAIQTMIKYLINK